MTAESRIPLLLAACVAAAVLCAVAAALLAGGIQGPGGSGGGKGSTVSTGQLLISLPGPVWGVLFISPLLIGFAVLIYRRLTEPTLRRASGMIVVVLLLLLVWFLLLHTGSNNGQIFVGGGSSSPPSGNNSSSGGGGGGFGGGSAGSTPVSVSFPIPPALLAVAVVGLCIVVLVLAVPGVVSRLVDRRRRGGLSGGGLVDRGAIAAVLGEAASALDGGADARETIVHLYLQLLARLRSVGGDTISETADEIRVSHLLPLGVPPDVGETLTRLFEEARYSSHALSQESAGRAERAIRSAEAALRAPRASAG